MANKSIATATGNEEAQLTRQASDALKAEFEEKEIFYRIGWWNKDVGDYEPVAYINWPALTDRLDEVDPGWEHSVYPPTYQHFMSPDGGNRVLVTVIASVTVLGVTRQGVSSVYVNDERDMDSATEKAETNAMKRAIAKFGPGRQLYEKEGMTRQEAYDKTKAKGESRGSARSASAGASAGGGSGLPLTVKMKGAFYGMAKSVPEFDGDVQALLDDVFGAGVKTEASNFTRDEVDSVFAKYGKK